MGPLAQNGKLITIRDLLSHDLVSIEVENSPYLCYTIDLPVIFTYNLSSLKKFTFESSDYKVM